MLIVKIAAGAGGAVANQVIFPALDSVPEGWARVPEKLEAQVLGLLPWVTLRVRGKTVTAVSDNAEARAAAMAALTDGGGDETGDASGGDEGPDGGA